MNLKRLMFSLSLGASLVAGGGAKADLVYDLAGDFLASAPGDPTAHNPNGVWIYGQYASGTIDPTSFAAYGTSDVGQGIFTGLSEWRGSGTDPNIVYNSNSTDVLPGSGTGNIDFKAHEVTFGPAGGPDVARFTAPTTGAYLLNAFFQTVQEVNSAPITEIIVGGVTPVFINPAEDSTGSPYSGILSLTAGETVDLVVTASGPGSIPKTTLVRASFTAVPEPSPMALAGVVGTMGFGGRLFARRFKGKSKSA